jgi:ADP-heptose synthase, bifunctional sugar kinase/adenylyltransferase
MSPVRGIRSSPSSRPDLARGDDALTAAVYANRAAGVVVGKVGTATAAWEEIEEQS